MADVIEYDGRRYVRIIEVPFRTHTGRGGGKILYYPIFTFSGGVPSSLAERGVVIRSDSMVRHIEDRLRADAVYALEKDVQSPHNYSFTLGGIPADVEDP